jgi:hypothetical protein
MVVFDHCSDRKNDAEAERVNLCASVSEKTVEKRRRKIRAEEKQIDNRGWEEY